MCFVETKISTLLMSNNNYKAIYFNDMILVNHVIKGR